MNCSEKDKLGMPQRQHAMGVLPQNICLELSTARRVGWSVAWSLLDIL